MSGLSPAEERELAAVGKDAWPKFYKARRGDEMRAFNLTDGRLVIGILQHGGQVVFFYTPPPSECAKIIEHAKIGRKRAPWWRRWLSMRREWR